MTQIININGQSLTAEQVATLLPKLPDAMRDAIVSKLTLNQKIQVLRFELRRECLERDLVIDALLALLVAKQHGILLGPPGTGKTFLIEMICKSISGAQFFSEQMSEFHKPENIFGALSPKELMEKGEFVRNTKQKLGEATIAYLDEIWKGPAPLMNMLLAVLNERVIYNPNPQKIPLRTLIGSSNELPEEPSTNALLDRFVYKQWVGYLSKSDNILSLWDRLDKGMKSNTYIRLGLDDLDIATSEASSVQISHLYPLLLTIKTELESAGYKAESGQLLSDKQQISDRKWPQIFGFLKAIAFIEGKSSVDVEIVRTYLADCLWFAPYQRDEMQGIIESTISVIVEKPKQIIASAVSEVEAFKQWVDTTNDLINLKDRSLECLIKLDKFSQEVEEARKAGSLATACDDAIESIDSLKDEVKIVTIENALPEPEIKALTLVSLTEMALKHWEEQKPEISTAIKSMTSTDRETKLQEIGAYADSTKNLKEHFSKTRQEIESLLNGKSDTYIAQLKQLHDRFVSQGKELATIAKELEGLVNV